MIGHYGATFTSRQQARDTRKAWLNPIPSADTSSPWRFLASFVMPHKGSRDLILGQPRDRVNRGPGGAPPVAPVTSTHALNAGAPRVPSRLPNLRDVAPSKETGRTFQEIVSDIQGRTRRRAHQGPKEATEGHDGLDEVPVGELAVVAPSPWVYAMGAGALVLAAVAIYFVARRKPR